FTAATSWQGRARAASDAPDDGSLWSTLHANAHRRDSDGQETKGTDPLKGAARNERQRTGPANWACELGLRTGPANWAYGGNPLAAIATKHSALSRARSVSFDGTIRADLRCCRVRH